MDHNGLMWNNLSMANLNEQARVVCHECLGWNIVKEPRLVQSLSQGLVDSVLMHNNVVISASRVNVTLGYLLALDAIRYITKEMLTCTSTTEITAAFRRRLQ